MILPSQSAVARAVDAIDALPLFDGHHLVPHDYDRALRLARGKHRLLLVNFSGITCVNSRAIEHGVFLRPEIRGVLLRDYVEARLRVDIVADAPGFEFRDRIKAVRRALMGENVAIPHFIIIDPQTGQVIREHGGAARPAKFLEFFRRR